MRFTATLRAMTTLLVLALPASAAQAQSRPSADGWPSRPITMIVPFPAGSATDLIARVVCRELSARLGQPLVIENRPGGDTTIGTRALARSTPDGYTLGFAGLTATGIAPSTHRALAYDPEKDLAPVSIAGRIPYVLVVYPGLGVGSLAELIALAKAKPSELNYSSAGEVSLANLGMLLITLQAGIKLTHVPYKSTAQSIVDISTGLIHAQIASVPPTLPLHQAGKVRALAVTTSTRIATMPEIPTISESGIPDYELSFWTAIFAPASTPADIVNRLNREIRAILATDEVKQTLGQQGVDAESNSPQELGALVRKEIAKFRDVVARTGIVPQ
jgi:tripartite-type tricarboxylate transporter receptor subunit TctC